ncbi:MAG: hypothetical protein ACYS7Y_04370 [Planctomycetota bacterium]|jgi:hypothetical protein
MRVYTKRVENCVDCPNSEWGRGGKWCMEGAGILTEGEGPLPECPLPEVMVESPLSILWLPVLSTLGFILGLGIGAAI